MKKNGNFIVEGLKNKEYNKMEYFTEEEKIMARGVPGGFPVWEI